MKRVSDGNNDSGSDMKRARANEREVRLLIPSKAAGSVIGKGGSNITKLRNDFNATISIPDGVGPERVMTILANEEDVLGVLKEAIPLLDEVVSRLKSSNINGTEIRVLIHQSLAGAVIGKGGAQIKELREETGANVRIFGEPCPRSSDRVLQIAGEPEKIVECLKKCLEILKNVTPRSGNMPYDSNNFDEYGASEYGGWGNSGGPPSGRGGGGGGGGRDGGYGRSGPPRGGPPPRSDRRDRDRDGGGMGPRGGMGGRGGGGGGGGGYGMPQRPLMNLMERSDEQTTTQVSIPKDLAGCIIGKGGARISKIRNESGARITIEETPDGSEERIITMKGTPGQIQYAQYLLQQCVRQNSGSSGGRK